MQKKKTSQKQIRANRMNALKSTGPKTPEGKRVARWNALKHGLLSKEVVIKTGGGKESGAAFRKLLTQLREDLQPEGVLEEMLVEKIAICYWRLRRVLRCEVGEIRKDLDQIRLGDSQGPDWPHGVDPGRSRGCYGRSQRRTRGRCSDFRGEGEGVSSLLQSMSSSQPNRVFCETKPSCPRG